MKKILLIGDSIRVGYDKYVKMAFDGVAEVYYPAENCQFSQFVIRHLINWKNELGLTDDIDLVHWNAGLWDDLKMVDGKLLTPIDVYKDNIDRICNIIKILFPKAKMIFATSTPVDESVFVDEVKRHNKDTEEYNAVAVEVVKTHGGGINDLYSLLKDTPLEYHSDLTHYYTKEGTEIITNHVIDHIEKTLSIKAKTLDYDAIFKAEKNIVGI